jgi:hypothetical protein
MLFALFYRGLFLESQGWKRLASMAITTTLFQIILYPGRLFKPVFKITRMMKRFFLDIIQIRRWDPVVYEKTKNMKYQDYLVSISVSYYLRQLCVYYSLITFVINFIILKYSKYNLEFYPSYKATTTKTLMIEMSVIFGIEAFCDILVRILCGVITRKRVIGTGKDEIFQQRDGKYRTILLYSLFATHMLHDIYLKLQKYRTM